MTVLRVSVLLVSVWLVKSEIYLHHTNDGLSIEYYDCVLVQSSLFYCRRPKEVTDLFRDNDTASCRDNGGGAHRFSELRSKNISVRTIQHQWKSSLERVDEYSRYLRDSSASDGDLCECPRPSSFGKSCEYRLPIGETFEETLEWQLTMRNANPLKVQRYGDIVCYETLNCDSGMLCLDWREICDGIQNCLSGLDEDHCDVLEMNQCTDEEYRCQNGMCIPDLFFLDGEFDCLDWSDEMQFKTSDNCPQESVNTLCDDHLCSPNQWSCGDGQCIHDRTSFQESISGSTCQSGRHQYFICELSSDERQWTMSNGRCHEVDVGGEFEESSVVNRSKEEECEYIFKCLFSQGAEKKCQCPHDPACAEKLKEACPSELIPYPRKAIVAPFLFFFFRFTRDWENQLLAFITINGTVRCGDSLITKTESIPFRTDLNARDMIQNYFCYPSTNFPWSESVPSEQWCHNANDSTYRCQEWNRCLSVTRIKDGRLDCLNGRDEFDLTEVEIEQSCASVRPHRFRCSADRPACLSVMRMGDLYSDCGNFFDIRWFGKGQELSSMHCNDQMTDECSLLRQYLEQSWKPMLMNQNEMTSEHGISFRSYCDTFWDLHSREDENLVECRRSWICPKEQKQCGTGQCFEASWLDDVEWDCADALDEHKRLNRTTAKALKQASDQKFANQSYFIPNTCHQTHPFLCLPSQATRPGFSCFNLSQIGDDHIDCAGAIDERDTLRYCSEPSTLQASFRCLSSNTCIPYHLHCLDNHRCPNRSDDEHWCSRSRQPSDCVDNLDFTCFDGTCAKRGQCSTSPSCPFGEDAYMCDYSSSFLWAFFRSREVKRSFQRESTKFIRLPRYPKDANISQVDSNSIPRTPLPEPLSSNISSPSLLPYWCNRGLGVLLSNDSIVCFCPPQYYGEKCEYHADRLSVLLHLNLSRSISIDRNDRRIVLKLLVLCVFNNQTWLSHQFHLRPSFESRTSKMITHFPYPRSSSFLQQRRKQFLNRSSLLSFHPYSIRIELYLTRLKEPSLSLIAVWKYPIFFDHLPVFRLAKVLHFDEPSTARDPCFPPPCHHNEQCQQLMNNRSQYICLCKTGSTGEHCSTKASKCDKDYCASGSLCQANSPASLREDSSPFCLCSLDRYGDRCSIEHDRCLSSPCLNKGLCVPGSQPDQIICLCHKEYSGSQCRWTRPSIYLSLAVNLLHAGAVMQFLQIDFVSLHLSLVDQQVFRTLPPLIEYFHSDRATTLPDIVVAKLYSSDEDLLPDLYLLSLHLDLYANSFNGTTNISSINRCPHVRAFSNGNLHIVLCSPEICWSISVW